METFIRAQSLTGVFLQLTELIHELNNQSVGEALD